MDPIVEFVLQALGEGGTTGITMFGLAWLWIKYQSSKEHKDVPAVLQGVAHKCGFNGSQQKALDDINDNAKQQLDVLYEIRNELVVAREVQKEVAARLPREIPKRR